LSGAALAAGSVLLYGCTSNDDQAQSGPDSSGSGNSSAGTSASTSSAKKGDITKPLARPKTIQESPALNGLGLPPVTERIPDNPYVIPHRWTTAGKYGGALQMVVYGTTGAANATSVAEFFYGSSLLRFQRWFGYRARSG